MELALISLNFLSTIDALLLMHYILLFYCLAGGTKRCRLSWLTNSAVVNEPKCGGWGGGWVAGSQPMSTACTWSPNKLWRSTVQYNSMFILCCLATCQLKHSYPDFSRPFSLLPSLFRQLATLFSCHPRVIILSICSHSDT